jgi:signal transduction histidine kinase
MAANDSVVHGELYELMAAHREELLEMCKVKHDNQSRDRSDEAVNSALATIIDHLIAALAREAGLDRQSPLPDRDPVAEELADAQQMRGIPIAEVALHIGAISRSIGALGARYSMCFRASEYQLFNQCLDSVMAAAMDRYLTRELEARDHGTTERIGFIAHELRNALSTARMAYALLRTGQVGLASRTADVLERAHARLEELVDQTLLDAHLRSRIPVHAAPVELEPVLHDVVDAIPKERGIAIVAEVEAALTALADERLLISALSNLVQNAVKFTHAGGRVELRARDDLDHVIVEIEDECGGLPTARPESLFEPRTQATPDRRGYGLGLAITREAIQRMGGDVFVRDLPGKGCIFGLRLQRART